MAPDLHLLLWMLFAAAFARGNDHFVNPPDISSQTGPLSSYPVYAVGDIITVSWVTAADFVDLVINQLNSPLTQIDRTPNSQSLSTGTYSWKVTTDGSDGGAKFDLTFSNVFNFMVFKTNSTVVTAQSAYFNITNSTVDQHGQRIPIPLTSTSSTRLPASSTSSTSSISSSLATTTTETSLLKTTPSPTSGSTSNGLSTGASVGIGVGVAVVGVAAIAGGIIWFLFRRRKHNAQQTPSAPYYDPQSAETLFKGNNPHANWSPPSELPAARKFYPSELPLTAPPKDLPTELPS